MQLLVHGSTYNHLYWDFPYQNTYYSYVRAATRAGYGHVQRRPNRGWAKLARPPGHGRHSRVRRQRPILPGPADQAPSQRITVPVLLLVGGQDRLFCAPDAFNCADPAWIRQFESNCYPPQAHLQVVMIPRTGHDLNLHYTAPLTFAVTQAWALAHVSP